jgi:hypothetical protein
MTLQNPGSKSGFVQVLKWGNTDKMLMLLKQQSRMILASCFFDEVKKIGIKNLQITDLVKN